ncbi:Rho termination factor N-terminal domain-containing protein [uncultured Clostridium sp.]|uniref:Rho termination factor N-terminal domain-containing protein n=1 Tax=uncultured Clostridium sp. TaxID=59620 RepID=UPI00258720D0|nr:Rho termination factor N-terminal domain-containing protein [uncultured Clostridium sp.]MDU1348276.1 Rho termination factor N-terminal domain-containing protein [Clostridium argentinense]
MSLTGFQRRRRELEENKKIEVENELDEYNSLGENEEIEGNKENINKDLEINYEELKVTELKELAKEKGIEGFEDMKKAELIQVLTK